MIDFKKIPHPCVLSKNPVNIQVFANEWTTEINIFPAIEFTINGRIPTGLFFKFEFINPDTNSTEEIIFIASQNYEDENYLVPDFTFSGTQQEYVDEILKCMNRNEKLKSYFDLSKNAFKIKATAKEPIDQLKPINYSDNVNDQNIIVRNLFHDVWKAKRRKGHRININVFFEKEYGSGNFELVSSQTDTVDNFGFQNIEISSILDSEIKNSFETPPLPDTTNPNLTNIVQKAKVLRRYYVEISEQWKDMEQSLDWSSTDILNVHFGGVSMEDYSRENIFNYLNSQHEALTWWKNKKRLYPNQKDWLSVMNVSGKDDESYIANLELLYKDGLGSSFNIGFQPLKKWETMTIPVGYEQLNIAMKKDVNKEVYGWKIKVTNNAGAFILNKTYLLHDPKNFKSKTLVYLNSFGVAESFVASGFFEKNIVTNTDIASKTLVHDYKSINGRDFVFNKSSRKTYKARSGILLKSEAKALKSMLNVAPVFLIENDLSKPVIIDNSTFVIDDESEITQTIEFKITKSLEMTNVSEMITKPSLHISENCGVFSAVVQSEEIITSFGDLNVSSNNVDFETIVHDGVKYNGNIKAETEGIYIFECQVSINAKTFTLSAIYDFQLKQISFKTENQQGTNNFVDVTLRSAIDENVFITSYNQDSQTKLLDAGFNRSIVYPVNPGEKQIEISASCLSNIEYFAVFSRPLLDFKISNLKNLKELNLLSTSISGHFSTANLKELEKVRIINGNLDSFEIGLQRNILELNLAGNNMDQYAIEKLLLEIYEYRWILTYNNFTVNIANNPGCNNMTPTAINLINGNNPQFNLGLFQFNIIVTY